MVDVGANDGKTYSNSYFFVKRLGWNAIMIEPYPDAFESLKKTHAKNPRVICLKIACSNTIGRQKLFIGVSNLLSTLCQDENDCFKVHRTTKTIDVETETLTNVLRENNFPKDISLLLIDTEGMDYEVLLGLDFEQYQPRIVVTEEYCWNMEKHRNKYQYLLNSRYSLYKRLGSNTIWIRK
jgi:FkbM family methyltransferase